MNRGGRRINYWRVALVVVVLLAALAVIAGGVAMADSAAANASEPIRTSVTLADDPHTVTDGAELLVLADGTTLWPNLHEGRLLTRWAVDTETGALAPDGQYQPPDGTVVTGVVAFDEGYAIRHTGGPNGTLAVLDANLTESATRASPPQVSLGSDGSHLFAASSEGFTVYDRSLERVGHAPLHDTLGPNDMGDVIVHDGNAYVVDNMRMPLYLFRVDVADPTAPAYAELLLMSAIGGGLTQQWIDPVRNRLHFIRTSTGQRGSSQTVYWTPLTGAETITEWGDRHSWLTVPDDELDMAVRTGPFGTDRVYERTRSPREPSTESGTRIADVTRTPPLYGTVTRNETAFLASVTVENSTDEDAAIAFGSERPLATAGRIASVDGAIVTVGSTDGVAPPMGFDSLSSLTTETVLHIYDPATDRIVGTHVLALEDPLAIRDGGDPR